MVLNGRRDVPDPHIVGHYNKEHGSDRPRFALNRQKKVEWKNKTRETRDIRSCSFSPTWLNCYLHGLSFVLPNPAKRPSSFLLASQKSIISCRQRLTFFLSTRASTRSCSTSCLFAWRIFCCITYDCLKCKRRQWWNKAMTASDCFCFVLFLFFCRSFQTLHQRNNEITMKKRCNKLN